MFSCLFQLFVIPCNNRPVGKYICNMSSFHSFKTVSISAGIRRRPAHALLILKAFIHMLAGISLRSVSLKLLSKSQKLFVCHMVRIEIGKVRIYILILIENSGSKFHFITTFQ